MHAESQWVVIKFGGTSVRNRTCWQNIQAIIERHLLEKNNVLVVCSAPSKVSDHLAQLIEEALQNNHSERLSVIENIYQTLAQDLAVPFSNIATDFAMLTQLCEGIARLNEASPKTRARIMAFGELMLTTLGAAFLNQTASAAWIDARQYLIVNNETGQPNNYLTATCKAEYDSELVQRFKQLNARVIVTQGFIGGTVQQETVLFGRGGSDVSASYFAAKLKARACEIWTDVPGVYTANPHLIPQARLLQHLDYTEVQEIASLGAKVLHPNCIAPVQAEAIPLYVKNTADIAHPGTRIDSQGLTIDIPVKAVIMRTGVYLISIESTKMWREFGFLATFFNCFKKHHVSIDLISTSQTSITVSLDDTLKPDKPEVIQDLLQELQHYGEAKLIGPCASISLVGRQIRSALPEISNIFEVFAAQKIYLVSQAANDLNLTFVVDEEQAPKLAKNLHTLLIEQHPRSESIGKSWAEEHEAQPTIRTPWWQLQRDQLLELAAKQAPAYVYYQPEVAIAVQHLKQCDHIDKIFYAIKANSHAALLQYLHLQGIGFECVSLGEIQHLLKTIPTLDAKTILFTPNFAPREEYVAALNLGVQVNIDNLYVLQHWPELFKNKNILLRLDLGQGYGHHKYVATGGSSSKFGIPLSEITIAVELLKKHDIQIIGLHAHNGSGNLQPELWQMTARQLIDCLPLFPSIRVINIGGGLGVPERPLQAEFNTAQLNDVLAPFKKDYPQLEIWLEPGRYLIAKAGVILARVTQLKTKGEHQFIGIETGMNSLIRPMLYGSYHEIVNLTRMDNPRTQIANVVGPICESGDTLGFERLFPETQENDVLLIANAGAYGHCMSSSYNLRLPAQEIYLVS